MILITGASGNLGREVAKFFPNTLKPPHKELDVSKRESVESYIKSKKPDTIIHLAAAVSPPKCESDKRWAWDTNVMGTIFMVDACKKFRPDCFFVLMSTPCVFNGEDDATKDEDYIQYPESFYGYTKSLQEMIVSRSGLKHLIIRGNFVPYAKWPYQRAFSDRRSNYLFAHQLARGIKDVVDAKIEGNAHVLGDKILSMYELAKLCPDSESVRPITLEEYYELNPNSCKLTRNMVMKSTRWKYYSIED